MNTSHILIGAGVVGRAIARAHADAGLSFALLDQDETMLRGAAGELALGLARWDVSTIHRFSSGMFAMEFSCRDRPRPSAVPLIIESVSEQREVKRALFSLAEQHFGAEAVFCSNTSTLRIGDLAAALSRPERLCGMHFFMPVEQRAAVEIIRSEQTSEATTAAAEAHARRLGKQPLIVGDGPGFVVNRLLSPYLNEAMQLLGRGVDAEQLERAAIAYGMPMSPLELIDWIGTRTVFDAGRVYWQAFPDRIDPSPIAPALLKRKRLGRASGGGFYDYTGGKRSPGLSADAVNVIESYRRAPLKLSDHEVLLWLAVPMYIEAALAYRQGIARSLPQLDEALAGGLGYDPRRSWLEFFASLGSDHLLSFCARRQAETRSLILPSWLAASLKSRTPTAALEHGASADGAPADEAPADGGTPAR